MPTRPQSLNRYAYTENNPANWTDPSGHACIPCLIALMAAGGALTLQSSTPREAITPGEANAGKLGMTLLGAGAIGMAAPAVVPVAQHVSAAAVAHPAGMATMARLTRMGTALGLASDTFMLTQALRGDPHAVGDLIVAQQLSAIDGLAPFGDMLAAGMLLTGRGRGVSNWSRRVLVVGESSTYEYAEELAKRHPDWLVFGATYDPDGLGFQTVVSFDNNFVKLADVDATRLDRGFTITSKRQFDAVIFNNPHILVPGDPTRTGQLTLNLIQGFVTSGRQILRPGGIVQANATSALIRKHRTIGSFLNTADRAGHTFGSSEYFAPFYPRYTAGGIFEAYKPENGGTRWLVSNLRSYEWR